MYYNLVIPCKYLLEAGFMQAPKMVKSYFQHQETVVPEVIKVMISL